MIGKVGRCSKGRPGLITGRKTLDWGESWVGIALDDGDPKWASRDPEILAETLDAWIFLDSHTDDPLPSRPPASPPAAIDFELKAYATEKQWAKYLAWIDGGSYYAAGKLLGLDPSGVHRAVRMIYYHAAQQGYAPDYDMTHPVPEGQTVRGVSTKYGRDGEIVETWNKTKTQGRPEEEVHAPLPLVAKVSTQYDSQGRVASQWVQTKAEDRDRLAKWHRVAEQISAEIKPLEPVPPPNHKAVTDLLACYPVGDHHLGMLSWDRETGRDWDITIAKQLLGASIDYLCEAMPPAETSLVAFLGDFMHYDSFEAKTPTGGNLLDADGRYPKMVDASVHSMRYTIDAALRKHQRVHVIVEIGNHDLSSTIFLQKCLQIAYENEPRVTIDMNPSHFHYYAFGKVLIGTHHGHGVRKPEGLQGLMAVDRPKEWGDSLYRYWWTGHVHHYSAKEVLGTIVESFRVLPPQDSWAFNRGYRAMSDMKAIMMHREHGETGRLTVNPGMFE